MHPKDAEGIANSVDPDQTARLFAQAYLSENLGSLRSATLNLVKGTIIYYMYLGSK